MMIQKKPYVKEAKPYLLKLFGSLAFNTILVWGIAHFYVKYYGGVWPDAINLWAFVKNEIAWILPIVVSLGGLSTVFEIFRPRKKQ